MANLTALVYRLSAMSYMPGVDAIQPRAKAEAELIEAVKMMQSECDSLRAERDRLLVDKGHK
jgi:hypothetical protein